MRATSWNFCSTFKPTLSQETLVGLPLEFKSLSPEAIDQVHAWFLCQRRHPETLDGGCSCGGQYLQLSERERQWLHTGISDWSCCDD